jgi:hypothetical protein
MSVPSHHSLPSSLPAGLDPNLFSGSTEQKLSLILEKLKQSNTFQNLQNFPSHLGLSPTVGAQALTSNGLSIPRPPLVSVLPATSQVLRCVSAELGRAA